jgi:small multidrug resistance family-3 protein
MWSMWNVRSSIVLFAIAVVEAGGCWAAWHGWRGNRAMLWLSAGLLALAAFILLASLRTDGNFGRVLAAYGGVFIAATVLWRLVRGDERPAGREMVGAALCAVGAAIILFGPRPG